MKKIHVLLSISILMAASLACGQSASSSTPTPFSPIPALSTDTPIPAADPGSIEGSYIIGGLMPDSTAYDGTLTITAAANNSQIPNTIYDLAWKNGEIGTGILIGNVLAASFGGPSCGAVFYDVDQAMNLTGVWITLDTKELGTEFATPLNPSTTLAGDYNVTGMNANGSDYGGSLSILSRDEVWQLVWVVGADTYDGVGIDQENVLAAAYGGDGCGVAAYVLQPNGDLDGVWGIWGTNYVGYEYGTKE